MTHQVVTKQGKRFVMVPLMEWRRVERLTARPVKPAVTPPALPSPDQEGHVPALAYIQVSIARDIVRERTALGLTQQQLAKLAGIRNETLCRLESGKHSPTVRTVEKIEKALQKAAKKLQRA